MDNRINNYQSFKGAFLIKAIPDKIKPQLTELFPKHRQIFDNFQNNGDVFLVVKNSKDLLAANFIKENKFQFKYYPELNTKSGFDSEKPQAVSDIINSTKPKVITSIKEMFEFLKPINKSLKTVQSDNISQILTSVGLDAEDVKIKGFKGYKLVTDKEGKVVARISPSGKFGMKFVFIEPKNAEASPLRYAVDNNGNIVAQYSSFKGIKQFRDNFNAAVEYNKK